MTYSPCNSLSEPAIVEQIITEFFSKSLHIILESRSPNVFSCNYLKDHPTSSPSSSSSFRPRDKLFNLALRNCPAALENFDLRRQSNLEPLVVNVSLIRRRSKDPLLNCWPSGHDEFVPENKGEKIVERWIVQYESRKNSSIARELHSGSKKSSDVTSYSSEIPSLYKKAYKRTIVLLRSLYVTVRLLPAYKLFRDLNSSGRICPFSLSHRISSFAEPFTRAEDAEMNQFGFVPVDTPCGRLSLSVSYIPILEDVSSEPSTPFSTQFIPDYVGNPTTDPFKRLHSLPSAGSLPTYVSLTRRHSWSNDHGATPSVSPSPLPTYSDSSALHCNPNPRLLPRGHIPHQLSTASASQTSSPESKLQLKKETLRLGDFQTGMALQKKLYSGKDKVGTLSGLKIPSCTSPWIPSRGSSRFSLLDEFDDSEFACPFAVDVEDLTNSCRIEPSDVDDHDSKNLGSGGLIPVRRSPDAVVGALIRLLKTAPPLRQDLSNSVRSSQAANDETWNQGIRHNKDKEDGVGKLDITAAGLGMAASGLFKSRTAADALEELKSYKQMKELLLRQVKSESLDIDRPSKSAPEGSSEF